MDFLIEFRNSYWYFSLNLRASEIYDFHRIDNLEDVVMKKLSMMVFQYELKDNEGGILGIKFSKEKDFDVIVYDKDLLFSKQILIQMILDNVYYQWNLTNYRKEILSALEFINDSATS